MATTTQEPTICNALLLRNAFKGLDNQRVIITVNGHVTLGSAIDPALGMQFTLEEWEQITEFVETQLLGDEDDKPESWEPDWAQINWHYNYVAADENGQVWCYEHKPTIGEDRWMFSMSRGSCDRLHDIEAPRDIHWTETLRARPGVSL